MNNADRRELAGRTRHRPLRSNIADAETEIDRLQAALRAVSVANTLQAAAALAGAALNTPPS